MFRLTPLVKNLVIINVAVFLAQNLLGSITDLVALWPFGSANFRPYQFFSYMFAHGDLYHLFFNMLGIIALGPMLEEFLGQKKLLAFVMVTGLGAGILYSGINYYNNIRFENKITAYNQNPDPGKFSKLVNENFDTENKIRMAEFIDRYGRNSENSANIKKSKELLATYLNMKMAGPPMVGASGIFYAILLACGIYFPNRELHLIFPPISLKVLHITLILGSLAIYYSFSGSGGDGIAHLAHLGGMVFAFVMIKYWQKVTG